MRKIRKLVMDKKGMSYPLTVALVLALLIALCVLLLVLFGADQMWSVRHPNEGKGISKMRTTAVRTYEKEGKVVKQ